MRPLAAPQIGCDLPLERGIGRLAQVVHEQNVLGGDRRVRLELEHPMAIGPLFLQQRLCCKINRRVERRVCSARSVRARCALHWRTCLPLDRDSHVRADPPD